MAEVGLLAPDARTELIEGEICDMPPDRDVSHSATVAAGCIGSCRRLLAIGRGWSNNIRCR